MNNSDADILIDNCNIELRKIEMIINGMGPLSNVVPYLTRYSIIKSCGTIEQCFKTIISDFCSTSNSAQANTYIDTKFRNSSMNPSYENICKSLKEFDAQWTTEFKEKIKEITNHKKALQSLSSLNEARNEFAHGGTPTVTFDNVLEYFRDSILVIEKLDIVVS